MHTLPEQVPGPRISRKRAVLLLSALVLIPAAVVLLFVVTKKPESLTAGDRILSIPVTDLNGGAQTLRSDLDGEHLWLIVSASCPICRQELTDLNNGHESVERITIVSLSSLDESRTFMRPFPRLQERTVVDANGTMERTYGRFRFPTALLMNGRGTLVRKWRGFAPTPLSGIKFNGGPGTFAQ
jgi:hypothetical protein